MSESKTKPPGRPTRPELDLQLQLAEMDLRRRTTQVEGFFASCFGVFLGSVVAGLWLVFFGPPEPWVIWTIAGVSGVLMVASFLIWVALELQQQRLRPPEP